MDIKNVAVLGANGAMGTDMAGLFASFGNANVYLVARNIEDARTAKKNAAKAIRAQSIEARLFAQTYDSLDSFIGKCDLIFESVAESLAVKKDVYSKIVNLVKPDVIIGSGTSGIAVSKLSESLPEELIKRFMVMHFSNPPYMMPLCEVVYTDTFEDSLKAPIENYLTNQLLRKVVKSTDTAAFLVNRIGFHFMNTMLQQAEIEKSKGGIDYIDAIFGPFTGRNIAPLATVDFAGLDVHKAIVDNAYENIRDYNYKYFKLPDFTQKLIDNKYLGTKTKKGLYTTSKDEDGNDIPF
ncbi:MAG: 3-hydroxyacyl-CoA dehydrogenase family protein, partial [Oscillospiraceae bacterium]